jgi:hypothetical protein
MAIPSGILEESTRNKNHQEFTLQWILADGKFLVISPGFLQEQVGECKDLELVAITCRLLKIQL